MFLTNPDGNEWEFFYTKADVDVESENENASTCCTSEPKVESKNATNC